VIRFWLDFTLIKRCYWKILQKTPQNWLIIVIETNKLHDCKELEKNVKEVFAKKGNIMAETTVL